MKKAIISMLLLSASLSPTVSVFGQDDEDTRKTDSLREELKKECVGKATVTKAPPYADGTYIPTGASYLNDAVRNLYSNKDYYSAFDTSYQSGELKPDFDYQYMISKGVTGNVNEVGMVYYLYFNQTYCQIIKWDTANNRLVAKTDVFNCTNLGLNTKFADGQYNFMGYTRKAVVNSKYHNDTRHNELLQSMMDVNTMDYNGDGIDDLFVVFGRTLRIYDGKTLSQLLSYTIRNERDNISPSSVVYDMNGDGINDYLCMYTHMTDPTSILEIPYEKANCADIDGLLIYSKRDSEGKVTYSDPVKKNVNDRSDFFEKHRTQNTINGVRSTLNMKLVYPEGKGSSPKLALAVNVLHQTDALHYIFDQQLTIIDVFPNMMDNATDWYMVDGFTTRQDKALTWYKKYWTPDEKGDSANIDSIDAKKLQYYLLYNRNSAYRFGKPALCAASVDGPDNPQKIFWVDSIYTFNSKTFAPEFTIQGKHVEDYGSGFDRVVGGQMVAIPNKEASAEMFAFVLADSKTQDWDDYLEWEDISFKLATLKKENGNWNLSVIRDYVLDGASKVKDADGKEITSKLLFGLTNTSRDKGMRVRLENAEVTITTPVIDHIICAAPILGDTPASISFDKSESQSVGRTISTSTNNGFSIDASVGFFGAMKVSVGESYSKTDSYSQSQTSTKTSGQGLSSSTGRDYVLFNCYVVDKYNYVVDECKSAPEMVGSKFSIARLRENFCRQFDKKVDDFNLLVRGSACPEITDTVLLHKEGDLESYPHGISGSVEEIKEKYGLTDNDAYIMTNFVTRSTDNTVSVSASFNDSESRSRGETESVSTKASISFEFSIPKIYSESGTFTWNGGASQGWTESMSLGEGTSVKASLPQSADDRNAYCLVYYKKHIITKEGAPYDVMIGNWYYQDINNKAKYLVDDDTDGTSGIDGIDNTGKEVSSVEYFDASGRQLAATAPGMKVKVTTYADGTKSTVKVMNN